MEKMWWNNIEMKVLILWLSYDASFDLVTILIFIHNLNNPWLRWFPEHPDADPANILPDGRYNHIQQVQERLRFLRFLLKDGQLWLCEPQAKQVNKTYEAMLTFVVCKLQKKI